MVVNDLKLVENIGILFESKVVLYGAGVEGGYLRQRLSSAGISVDFFCDSNPERTGKYLISPEGLKELDEKESVAVIVSVNNDNSVYAILKKISELGLRTENIFTFFGAYTSLWVNINDPRINKDYRDLRTSEGFISLNRHRFNLKFIDHILRYNIYDDSIVVLTPTKVGTTSLGMSLASATLNTARTHYSTNLWSLTNFILDVNEKEINFINKCLKAQTERFKSKETAKIITVVREPVSRDISLIFELMSQYLYYDFTGLYKAPSSASLLDFCIDWVDQNCIDGFNYGQMFDWFDSQIKTAFGIDIFEHPFDKEKGYSIIKKDNIEILVMKLEKMNSLESVIGEFGGCPDFNLVSANEGNKKAIGHLYNDVKKKIKYPHKLIDFYYKNNPRMDHFYSEEEKAAFLKRFEIAD